MTDLKLPVLKRHLDIIHSALVAYRKNGVHNLTADELIEEQRKITAELKKSDGDVGKALDALWSYSEEATRAKFYAFQKVEADLDIMIARVQILKQKAQGRSDNALITDFLKDVLL